MWFWLVQACTSGGEIEATGTSSEFVPSVLVVHIDGVEGEAFVEYGLDGFDQRTPVQASTEGDLAVLGLKASHRYQWRAVVIDDRGERHTSAQATFEVPAPPAGLRPLTAELEPEATVQYVLATVVDPAVASYVAIFDRDGDWVWWMECGPQVAVTAKLGWDGASVAWSQYDFASFDDVGSLVRVSLDGSTRTDTHLQRGHHDFVQHDDGTVAFLGITFADVTLGDQTRRMAADTLMVGPEAMTPADEPATVFSMFDDFPLAPAVTCNHVAAVVDKLGERNVHEWSHGNSLLYLPEEDAYYVNDKFTDWLFKVDRASGQVEWIMNGRGSDFLQPNGNPVWTAPDRTSLWSHGHLSDLWSGGGLMFDNGDHHPQRRSRVLEFSWDEAQRKVDVVWEFPHPDGGWTGTLGDARRMPDDHVLVTWAGLGELHEVTRDGRVVWRAETGGDQMIGRIVPITHLYSP